MDWASLAGLILGLTAILSGQALEGGHLASLLQPAAFVVVVIGTTGSVLLQSGMASFMRGTMMLRWVFSPPVDDFVEVTRDIKIWSATARREGLLSLERYLPAVQNPFVARALHLMIDGVEPGKMREILEVEIALYERRERQAVKIWEAAGGYAPTIGILGAVLGLIHVMENLSDPSKLGSGIAVAFVATIYGVGLANLVFLPIANKLKGIVSHEVARREMISDVFFSIANGDNAHVIAERMSAYR
ncbi:MAG TPA: flagellar motor protein [Noviherbaspirillum sp.]|nr:flagellar motor protein [Noviherbaspirillum sp.]